ncbi:MAG: hypothetical protein WKF30_01685 [Pyrinomonadaceae bacterium]
MFPRDGTVTGHTSANNPVALEAFAAQFPPPTLRSLKSLLRHNSTCRNRPFTSSATFGDYKTATSSTTLPPLRTLIEKLFNGGIADDEQRELLAVLYHPQEALEKIGSKLTEMTQRRAGQAHVATAVRDCPRSAGAYGARMCACFLPRNAGVRRTAERIVPQSRCELC